MSLDNYVPEDVEALLGAGSTQVAFDQRLKEMKAMNIPKVYIDVTNVPYGVELPKDIPISDALRRDHLEAIESTGAVIRHSLDHLPVADMNLPSAGHRLIAEWCAERRAREY